jgi:hypothetical protein
MKPAYLSMLALGILTAAAAAQPTAFTYQGRLRNGANLASGVHDFRFTLFTNLTGGVVVATPQCVDNLTVAEGLFTATIDFGAAFTTNQQRFLQIEVRADTGLTCANATGFTVLSPRQPVMPVPIANHAKSAFSLDAADGSPANAVFVDAAGNVGVGTTTPASKLHITGVQNGVLIDGPGVGAPNASWLEFRDSAGARTGYVGDGSTTDSSIYLAADTGDVHLYTAAGAALTAKPSGNIGINMVNPGGKLDIQGSDNSNVLLTRRTGGGLAHNLFIDNTGNGGLQVINSIGVPEVQFRIGQHFINNGNLGIGTIAPLARLDVRGNIRLGLAGELHAAGGVENLRMIRGAIDGNGSIDLGQGFTSQRIGEGLYRITFNTPFTSTPCVTLSAVQPFNQNPRFATFVQSTSNGAMFDVFILFGNADPTDSDFHFIAVGPR